MKKMMVPFFIGTIAVLTICCTPQASFAQEEFIWKLVARETGSVWGAECSNASDCMMAVIRGIGIESNIKRSTDGGSTWTTVWSDTGYNRPERWPLRLFDLAYPTPRLGIVAADSGWILRTTDGGYTWMKQRIDTIAEPTLSISMYDSLHGAAVVDYPNRLYLTRDGGASWREIASRLLRPPGWEVFPFDPVVQTGPNTILCILDDTVYHRAVRSTDGGLTWSLGDTLLRQYPDASTLTVDFIDTLRGWATTRHRFDQKLPPRGIILNTTDGGLSWNVLVDSISGGLTTVVGNIAFRDSLHGLTEAWYDIFRTEDGGASWSVDNDDSLGGGISRLVYEPYHPGLSVGALGHVHRYLPIDPSTTADEVSPTQFSITLADDVLGKGERLLVDVRLRTPAAIGLELFTLRGERIAVGRDESLSEGVTVIDVPIPALASGTYLLVARSGPAVITCRFHVVD